MHVHTRVCARGAHTHKGGEEGSYLWHFNISIYNLQFQSWSRKMAPISLQNSTISDIGTFLLLQFYDISKSYVCTHTCPLYTSINKQFLINHYHLVFNYKPSWMDVFNFSISIIVVVIVPALGSCVLHTYSKRVIDLLEYTEQLIREWSSRNHKFLRVKYFVFQGIKWKQKVWK